MEKIQPTKFHLSFFNFLSQLKNMAADTFSGSFYEASLAPWARPNIMSACEERLESTLGPVYYNGEITETVPDGPLFSNRKPCIIIIKKSNGRFVRGLGCFYGNGHVLTAYHVVKNVNHGCKIFVIFPTSETSDKFLVYKAFRKLGNTYKDRDQAFLKLYGKTSPLGDGLQNQIDKVSKNVYFYILTDLGRFQKQECKVKRRNSCIFEMCKSGRAGDSGSPIFCEKGKWIGVYLGENKDQFGLASQVFSNITPWSSSGPYLELCDHIIF